MTCDKTNVNENSNSEEREPQYQDDEKSESEELIEQRNPKILHKNRPYTNRVGDSSVKHLHGKFIASKSNFCEAISRNMYQSHEALCQP